MFFFIYLFFKLMIKLVVFSVWVCWAMLALTAILIASATGHQRAANQWAHSLRWHHLF